MLRRLIHGVPGSEVQAIGYRQYGKSESKCIQSTKSSTSGRYKLNHEAVVYEASHRNWEMHDPCIWSSGSRAGQI